MGIGAAIGAVATIGGAAIASSGANKAADKAAAASDRSAELSAQVQRETYAENKAALSPWQQSGLAANSMINALLGIQTPAAATGTQGTPTPQPTTQVPANPASGFWNSMVGHSQQAAPSLTPGIIQTLDGTYINTEFGVPVTTYLDTNGAERPISSYTGQPQTTATPAPTTTAPTGQTAQQAAEDAFARYRGATGYQFRVNQGQDALNSGFGASGTLQSGAALKSLEDYRQGTASAEFGNYLNALGNQQGIGFSAASAQAGVGQNYANSLGNIYQQQGANQANAALVKGQNNAMLANSIGTSIGNAAGQIFRPQTVYSPAYGGNSLGGQMAVGGSIF
jgi:hypothetical protein